MDHCPVRHAVNYVVACKLFSAFSVPEFSETASVFATIARPPTGPPAVFSGVEASQSSRTSSSAFTNISTKRGRRSS